MKAVTNLMTKDKDGEDDVFSASNLEIETVSNGWILRVVDEEETEYTEVFQFHEADKLLGAIQTALIGGA